jgi:hypothetical protein
MPVYRTLTLVMMELSIPPKVHLPILAGNATYTIFAPTSSLTGQRELETTVGVILWLHSTMQMWLIGLHIIL